LLESFGGFVVNIDAKGKPSEKISEEIVVFISFLLEISHKIDNVELQSQAYYPP